MDQSTLQTCAAQKLGANWIPGEGTHFRVSAGVAVSAVDLLLFPDSSGLEHQAISMNTETAWDGRRPNDWVTFVPDVNPGTHYGFRVRGPFAPKKGLRYDHSKLLCDPAGRLLGTHYQHHDSHLTTVEPLTGRLKLQDNLPYAPRTVIGDPHAFDWEGDEPLGLEIPAGDVVFYEANVRGATIKANIDGVQPGTYAAIASDAFIEHLKKLQVTVLELYVVSQSLPGYGGYWGYMSLLFGAPDWRFASRPEGENSLPKPLQVEAEFKNMVKRLHQAGIALCLDLVPNHTLEGNERGPTFSLRGFDNFHYLLCGSPESPDSRHFYKNWSGTGNALNFYHEPSRRLLLEVMERLVLEYHVDMFRFDLGGAMFSHDGGHDPEHPLRVAIDEHPFLSRTVKTMEPWSGHAADHFCFVPVPGWSIWSSRFRDGVRKFWLGGEGQLGEFIASICGSRDWYPPERCGWYATVNGICFHDGFSLAQWLSHNDKTNEDGHGDNISSDCGHDGPISDDDDSDLAVRVRALRWRLWKAAFATLAFSPMPLIRAGDERLYYLGSGHNNPHDLDDEVNGVDWNCGESFLTYVTKVMELRHRFFNLGRMIFTPAGEEAQGPYGCYYPLGEPMPEAQWSNGDQRSITLFLPGLVEDAEPGPDSGDIIRLFNANDRALPIVLPKQCRQANRQWTLFLHTGKEDPFASEVWQHDQAFELEPRSEALFVSMPH